MEKQSQQQVKKSEDASAPVVTEEEAREYVDTFYNDKAPRGAKCKGRKSDRLSGGRTPSFCTFACVAVVAAVAAYHYFYGIDTAPVQQYVALVQKFAESLTSIQQFACALVALAAGYLFCCRNKKADVFLLEFITFKNRNMWVKKEDFMRVTTGVPWFTPENIGFQERVYDKSGIGETCMWPKALGDAPPKTDMHHARDELIIVFSKIFKELFEATGVKPSDIDILIVNASLFCPTPSITSMIVNHFKMREDVLTYNLGGMGCSAGLISLNLARDLLQAHPNKLAAIFSTEPITPNWYKGNNKGMLLQNVLFRTGGAAVLLSNKPDDRKFAKYKLLHSVRVHKGYDEDAYQSVMQEDDDEGHRGVRLARNLIDVAGKAITSNLTKLGPLVLPVSEQAKFVWTNIIQRKLLGKKIPSYVPDFKKCFDHFCIHAGGRGVLDGIEKNLNLTADNIKPSRATLYTFANTSSSSVWYELEFSEKSEKIKRGDKVFQLAFGSGFKCNTAVWQAL